MLTKMKLAIVACSVLLCGVAAAEPAVGLDKQAWKAKRIELKAKMLAKFDTNQDGKLDEAERAVMREQRATAAFKRLDTNGDGQLSLSEFKAAKRFGKHHARRGFRHRKQ